MKIIKKNAFGLDIGDTVLKLVYLNNKREVISRNSMSIPEGLIEKGVIMQKPEVEKAIRKLIKEVKGKKIQTKNVVACLPEPQTYIKIFELPAATKPTGSPSMHPKPFCTARFCRQCRS